MGQALDKGVTLNVHVNYLAYELWSQLFRKPLGVRQPCVPDDSFQPFLPFLNHVLWDQIHTSGLQVGLLQPVPIFRRSVEVIRKAETPEVTGPLIILDKILGYS